MRTKYTVEELRDIVPTHVQKELKRHKCFNKFILSFTKYVNNLDEEVIESHVKSMAEQTKTSTWLLFAFYWKESNEGYKYWDNVYSRISN